MRLFVALEFTERRETGIFRRAFNILTRPKARLEQETAFGVRFGRLSAPLQKGIPPWEEIAELAGRWAGRLLLPDDVKPPEDFPVIGALSCPRYERRVLGETACELVRRTRMPMYRRVLGLIDRDGDYTELALGPLKHYTSVKVVTERPELYEAAAEKAMEELGAPVLIGSAISTLSDCVLILAPGEAAGEEEGEYLCPVLAGGGFRTGKRCDVIRELETASSPELKRCCPGGISPHRFAAALYEEGGVETGNFIAVTMRHNHQKVELSQMVRHVMACAGTLSLY